MRPHYFLDAKIEFISLNTIDHICRINHHYLMRFIIVGDHSAGALKLFKQTAVHLIMIRGLVASAPPASLVATVQAAAAKWPKATVVFMAGNNDVHAHIYSNALGEDGDGDFPGFMRRGVASWGKWIRDLKLTNPVAVGGTVMPTVSAAWHQASLQMQLDIRNDKSQLAELCEFLQENPEVNDIKWRGTLVCAWNLMLQEVCDEDSEGVEMLPYLDCNAGLLDKDGLVEAKFHHVNPRNNTLLWEPQTAIWQKRLGLTDKDLDPTHNEHYRWNKARSPKASSVSSRMAERC